MLVRNDYLFEVENNTAYQVEFNQIAAGLGNINDKVRTIQKIFDHKVTKKKNGVKESTTQSIDSHLAAFQAAHEAYGNPEAIMIIIIDEGKNVFSQTSCVPDLELLGISTREYTFKDLNTLGEFDESTATYSM